MTLPNTSQFRRLSQQTIFLWEYQWLSIETFLISRLSYGHLPDLELVASLLADPVYHFSYQTHRTLDKSQGIHGPFLISKMSPASFRLLEVHEFHARATAILASMRGDRPPGPEADAPESEACKALRALTSDGTTCLELALEPSDPTVHHEWWEIVYPFHEFLVIDQQRERLSICVFAAD